MSARRLPPRPSPRECRALGRAARAARRRAYAPYSRFAVGAALRTTTGRVVTGVNVENASYPLTICAERAAAARAVAEGCRRFDLIAVVADSKPLTTPCGACRQVLWEICGDCWVWLENLRGETLLGRLSELLPLPFDARRL